jgi:hypothetical protein
MMECWQLSHDEIMRMPTTRRLRMIVKKSELEKERERKQRR